MRAGPLAGDLPAAQRVLAVCAHPDDESFGLGGILGAYADRGVDVAVLSLTRGEASALSSDATDLAATRTAELRAASAALGVRTTLLRDFRDGGLDETDLGDLVAEVADAIGGHGADLVLTFHPAGITGHPDHQRATAAAREAASRAEVDMWSWYVPDDVAEQLNAELGPSFTVVAEGPHDRRVPAHRERQRAAMACHRSQADDIPTVERMLALLGDSDCVQPLPPVPGHDAPGASWRDHATDPGHPPEQHKGPR